MLKRMRVIIIIVALGSIAAGLFGLLLSVRDLNRSKDTYTVTGKIYSYEYDQYNKHSSYYLQADIDGETTTLEIPDLYAAKFKRSEFEKTYSAENNYSIVVLKEDYNDSGLIPIIGLKSSSSVFLDEQVVMKELSANSYVGLIVSPVLLVAGLAGMLFCCLPVSKKWFS